MPTLINDPTLEDELIAERRDKGLDSFDEVWDGVYVMAPIANIEHQAILSNLTIILGMLVQLPRLGEVYPGGNISDREDDWTKNYRVPDVLVFLNGNPAEKRITHWFGGPDFAIEIASEYDRSRQKIDFYSSVGVRELLIIDRDPWQLELFRATNGRLQPIAVVTPADGRSIDCQVVPLSLRLLAGNTRPAISLASASGETWTI